MGDGINDSPPLKQSDVGISVDTAVDIAKETADIILLEKDLNVLEKGVIIGRKTFTNILKYIKMATSGNFGNMLSIIIASLALPFLPMLPVHILIQNLLNDFAQIGMPFDNVDTEYLLNPKKWNTSEIKKNMFIFGTISTIFDLLCFLALWFIMKFNTTEKSTFIPDWLVCIWNNISNSNNSFNENLENTIYPEQTIKTTNNFNDVYNSLNSYYLLHKHSNNFRFAKIADRIWNSYYNIDGAICNSNSEL